MRAPASAPAEGSTLLRQPPDLSLVLGGPLFQLLLRAHLSDDALTLVRQRVIVITLLAWLPLLLLSALDGQMLGGEAAIPFLLDAEVHIRFLVALPLLIVAELVVHRRMRPLLAQFLERNLIPEHAMPRFEAAITSAFRLRNSVLAELLLIALVYGFGVLVVFLLLVILGPLFVFAPQLAQAKRQGLREYGALAERYVREFDVKWLRGGARSEEPFVGSADIQSLADLTNGYEVVQTMRLAPITRDAILRLAVATVAPIVPLLLTMMPFEELVRTLLGILF